MPASTRACRLSKKKRLLFRLLAVALSLLFCFLCLEIGLRIWGPDYHQFAVSVPPEMKILDGDTVLFTDAFEYYSNPRRYFDVRRADNNRVIYGLEMCTAGSRTEGAFAAGAPARRIPEGIDVRKDVLAFLTREDMVLALAHTVRLHQLCLPLP